MTKTPPSNRDQDADLLIDLAAGVPIFSQGQPGNEMYIIESGEVEIVKQFGPQERRLAVLEVGDFFGEMSLLEELPRSATARALTECRLLKIDVSTFDEMLRNHPEVTIRMMRKLAHRLREYEDQDHHAHQVAAGVLVGVSSSSETGHMKPILPEAAAAAQPGRDPASSPEAAGAPAVAALPAVTAALVHRMSRASFAVEPGLKNIIGRFDPATGTHPEIDLEEIDSQRSLSRRHARIWADGGKFFVREEIGAANSTFLRGKRLSAGVDHEIRDGDRLKLGLVELLFRVRPES